MYNGIYGWDDAKNDLNVKNHGFDFWHGLRVFEDPDHIVEMDRIDDDTKEERWDATGLVNGTVLVTTHIIRVKSEDVENTYTRLISSRNAERWEEKTYFEQFD